MPLLTITQETYTQDGLCIKACPVGLIEWGANGYPQPIAEAGELCIRCGHCVAVCPTASLDHQDIHPEQCSPIREEHHLSPEQCEQFVRSWRSIRNYKDRPVEKEKLARLIDIARYAPSAHNTQGAQWLVLGNREELNRLAGLVANWMGWMIENKPDLVAMMHMERTLAFWKKGKDVFLRGAPALIVAHASIVILRYQFLALEQRRQEDPRTFGALFRACCQEMKDLSFIPFSGKFFNKSQHYR